MGDFIPQSECEPGAWLNHVAAGNHTITDPSVVPKVSGEDGDVRLKFVMHGHQVLDSYAKRGDEPDFTLLALDTASAYVDGRPPLVAGQPETRQYRASFRDNDSPVGDWCDIITFTARA